MKNNTLWTLIVLLLFVSLPYFLKPYSSDEISEGFRGGKGGRKGGGRKGRVGGARRAARRSSPRRGRGGRGRMIKRGYRGHRGRGWRRGYNRPARFYRRSSYRRYPYYGGYGYGYGGYGYPYYSTYDILLTPYLWGSPYGYTNTYNWFDFRNCPSGCVANSGSPSGYSCVGDRTGFSCQSDYDCSGCNFPTLNYY